MKRVICDQCRTELEPDTYGGAPLGSNWIEMNVRDGKFSRHDFCSTRCAIAALEKREAELTAPAPTVGGDNAASTTVAVQ